MPQDTCFIGKVEYKKEKDPRAYLGGGGLLSISPVRFARSLLLKRRAFKHESEVRLLHFGSAKDHDEKGLYRYAVDPHTMITQIMADPNRNRVDWLAHKQQIKAETGFAGKIERSKIYDPPEWALPVYKSGP
jgi:hypothetical protein